MLLTTAHDNPTDAMSTDLTLAHSGTMTIRAMHQLKLTGSVSTFLANTTVVNLTDRVLQITVKAKSPAAPTVLGSCCRFPPGPGGPVADPQS